MEYPTGNGIGARSSFMLSQILLLEKESIIRIQTARIVSQRGESRAKSDRCPSELIEQTGHPDTLQVRFAQHATDWQRHYSRPTDQQIVYARSTPRYLGQTAGEVAEVKSNKRFRTVPAVPADARSAMIPFFRSEVIQTVMLQYSA